MIHSIPPVPRSFTALLLLALLMPNGSFGQEGSTSQVPLTRMLFVMDASNSMNAFWGNKPKIATAREILLKSLKELEGQPDLEIALRLYGHQSAVTPGNQDCDDTNLEVPFLSSTEAPEEIRRVLMSVVCQGTTPIARSLEKAGGDFPSGKKENGRAIRNIIILITDGIEACDEDPCAVSKALMAKDIVLKPFVIGIGLDDMARFTFECVGNYFDAGKPEVFEQVLKIVVTEALNSTTAQINLLTVDQKPTETNVSMTLYDKHSGKALYNYVHTMGRNGKPDTLSIDPLFTYRLVAHTIPPSVRDSVTVKPGIHNIIALDAGQGDIDLRIEGGWSDAGGSQAIVRKEDQATTLHVQELNSVERYRVGTYDLEILTLPRLLIDDVIVQQSKTTLVQIPRPGVLNVSNETPGHGSVYLVNGAELEWVADLDSSSERSQFKLLPGEYKVLYRSRNSKQTILSLQKDVSIKSGISSTVNF